MTKLHTRALPRPQPESTTVDQSTRETVLLAPTETCTPSHKDVFLQFHQIQIVQSDLHLAQRAARVDHRLAEDGRVVEAAVGGVGVLGEERRVLKLVLLAVLLRTGWILILLTLRLLTLCSPPGSSAPPPPTFNLFEATLSQPDLV